MAQLRESQKELEVLSKSTFSAAESMRELWKTINSKETQSVFEDEMDEEEDEDKKVKEEEMAPCFTPSTTPSKTPTVRKVDKMDPDVMTSSSFTATPSLQQEFQKGDVVEARFGSKKEEWYPGLISDARRILEDGAWRYSVQFTDGSMETGLDRRSVRVPERILPGTSVICWWNDERWFSGVVEKVDGDEKYNVFVRRW